MTLTVSSGSDRICSTKIAPTRLVTVVCSDLSESQFARGIQLDIKVRQIFSSTTLYQPSPDMTGAPVYHPEKLIQETAVATVSTSTVIFEQKSASHSGYHCKLDGLKAFITMHNGVWLILPRK